jgi:hypothetical protein
VAALNLPEQFEGFLQGLIPIFERSLALDRLFLYAHAGAII